MIYGPDTDVRGDHNGNVVERKHCFTSRHLLIGYYFIVFFWLFTPLSSADIRLEEVTQKARFHYIGPAAGASWGDFDGDGWPDLWVGNHNGLFGTNGSDPTSPFTEEGPHQLFQNAGNSNHWLEVELEGVKSNHDGIGAKLILEAGGTVQVRGQGGGVNRFSQNHQRIHFGLGSHAIVD